MFGYNKKVNRKEVLILLKDRGTIKWTSLMLPEHVEELKRLWDETKLMTKPQLDEQQLEEINQLCLDAFTNGQPVQISYYKSGIMKQLNGTIVKLDPIDHKLHLQTADGRQRIEFASIIKITTSP